MFLEVTLFPFPHPVAHPMRPFNSSQGSRSQTQFRWMRWRTPPITLHQRWMCRRGGSCFHGDCYHADGYQQKA